ncbi:MAG: hypothetical protein N3D15_02005 [Syntrophorhabdaceae bacterium]|nr:hypothetical protein [Syntrophorhabdaceae bacterium]
MKDRNSIISEVLSLLNISERVNKIFVEDVPSPWDEKAFIKRKKGYLEVKLRLWEDSSFLYGRIYRLFLYIYDVLREDFHYDPSKSPDEEKEPRLKDRHNQIWSIYVDSRLERRGIENFFDRITRKNIFVDSEKELSWEEASLIFQELWNKEDYTYPEITEITYNLSAFAEKNTEANRDKTECLVNNLLSHKGVIKQIERLPSTNLRNCLNDLLSFTAYKCKDTYIGANYYGIYMTYNKKLFVEIIPAEDNTIFLTIIDPFTNKTVSIIVNENTDMKIIQEKIFTIYKMMAQE